MTHLENQAIKGVTIRLVYAVIGSTVIMVASLTGAYYGLKAEIQSVATTQESKWMVREEQYKNEKERQDKTEEIVSTHEKRITAAEVKLNN